jgi:hypothetical protein
MSKLEAYALNFFRSETAGRERQKPATFNRPIPVFKVIGTATLLAAWPPAHSRPLSSCRGWPTEENRSHVCEQRTGCRLLCVTGSHAHAHALMAYTILSSSVARITNLRDRLDGARPFFFQDAPGEEPYPCQTKWLSCWVTAHVARSLGS